MAVWACSSVLYAGYTKWVSGATHAVGDLIRPTAPAYGNTWVFRASAITTGISGVSEPTWTSASGNNATIADGGVTWTNVTGQSTYGRSAAAGDVGALTGKPTGSTHLAAGDTIACDDNHSETFSGANTIYQFITASSLAQGLVSVNHAGAWPPTNADLLAGAIIAATGNLTIYNPAPVWTWGITFKSGSTLFLNFTSQRWVEYTNSSLQLTGASGAIQPDNAGKIILNGTTAVFSNASQSIHGYNGGLSEIEWINTSGAISGTLPTTLFTGVAQGLVISARGVDFSGYTSGTIIGETSVEQGQKVLFEECKLAAGATIYPASPTDSYSNDDIHLVNCDIVGVLTNARYNAFGTVTVDRSTTLASGNGAADAVGALSYKLVSSAYANSEIVGLELPTLDQAQTAVGVARTATIELIASSALNTSDLTVELEYLGTASSYEGTIVSSRPLPLAATAALATSTATWNSPPGTPVAQHIQLSFTPQTAGRLRARVVLRKASTTVWINPVIIVT